jgi:hypothetical protein
VFLADATKIPRSAHPHRFSSREYLLLESALFYALIMIDFLRIAANPECTTIIAGLACYLFEKNINLYWVKWQNSLNVGTAMTV